MNNKTAEEISGASFSDCRQYRYALWRIWDESKPLVMFIGLNPSTASESSDDPTIRRVKSIAKNLGFGGVYMMNCFPLVSTDPSVLESFYDAGSIHDTKDIENMRWLLYVSKKCTEIIFAWGNFKEAEGRGQSLAGYFKNAKALHINKNGSPKHPLYCKADIKPVDFIPNNLQS